MIAVQVLYDIGKVDEVVTFDFDQPQSIIGVGIKNSLDERRFSRSTRAPKQGIIGRESAQELPRIAYEFIFLVIDVMEVVQ